MEVASALLETLIKLSGYVNDEFQKISKAEESLKKLETTSILAREMFIKGVNTFQLDVDGTLRTILRNRIDNLTNLCFDAQDLMEDVLDTTNHKSCSSKRRVFKSMLNNPRNSMWPRNILELQKKLDGIVDQVKSLVDLTSKSRDEMVCYNSHLDLNLLKPLIGREDDVNKIIQLLNSGDSGHNGVSILGIDGLGKTMLAEAILLDKRILEQFCFILRVPLSNGIFNFKEATNELIKLQEGSVGKKGVFIQQNQRLLVLFDNLLYIKSSDWTGFWDHIKTQPFAANSKVLVTTFIPEVSRITCTTTYYLKRLSDEDCKQVIVKKTLLCKPNLPESHLSHIANILAKKCEGLPLVARVLGTVLAQYDMSQWGDLLERDSQDLCEVKREVLLMLKLNYSTMKPQLKLCLAYFSLFPHKYLFRKNDLIHLWVGQDIISQREGNDCFSDLQAMSILQHSDDVNYLENPIYELHKFSYIFSQLDASTICLRLEEGMSSLSGSLKVDGARHFSLSWSGVIQPATWDQLQKLKQLRTFLSLSDPLNNQLPAPTISEVPPRLFKALSRLRVLSLKGTTITELPDSIYRLKRLRYLDISFTSINKLPETLCELSKLKFLKLKNTQQLCHLPPQFQKLTSMLYIDWELHDIARLTVPSHIGRLSSLQTLPLFTVGDDQGGYSIAELKEMKCLQGSICIRYLENVIDKDIAEEAMLKNKISLKKIELQWMRVVNAASAKEVLTGLEPNDCLTDLTIKNYGGNMFPTWISNPSRNLRNIHLMRCPSCDVLPTLGVLETLETLVIEDFSSLASVDRQFCVSSNFTRNVYFQALKSLTFKGLDQLQGWSGLEANDMPRLCILKILSCPQLINLPSLINLSSLVELEIVRCQGIRSLPELPESIESLKISESNFLKEQCVDEGGGWHKVVCIPKVEIDGSEIQTSGGQNDVQTLPDDQQQNILFQGYHLVMDNVGGILSRLGLRN